MAQFCSLYSCKIPIDLRRHFAYVELGELFVETVYLINSNKLSTNGLGLFYYSKLFKEWFYVNIFQPLDSSQTIHCDYHAESSLFQIAYSGPWDGYLSSMMSLLPVLMTPKPK